MGTTEQRVAVLLQGRHDRDTGAHLVVERRVRFTVALAA